MKIRKKYVSRTITEKLYIKDRAVSNWERGLSLQDADKMLDLCNLLDINANELFVGEKIDMKDDERKMEEFLVEMANNMNLTIKNK